MSEATNRGRGMPTLEMIAAEARVSRATASRVVNGSTRVSPDARRAVEAAVAKLGYLPNRAARSLVTRLTGSVALVLSEPEELVLSDPFLTAVVRAVGHALANANTEMVLKIVGTDDERARLGRYLLGGDVDGVILASFHDDHPPIRSLTQTGFPAVLLGRPLGRGPSDTAYVDTDNVDGARQAVRHLRAGGRRRIATVTGPLDMAAGLDRLDGYRQELQGPGIVAFGDFTMRGGETATAALLDQAPDLDAVFAANDLMALGAIRVLRGAGRRIPDDVAVVGFDDDDLALLAEPPLTTIRQPVQAMARALVDSVLTQIGGGTVGPPVVLPPELVVRESA